MGLHFLWWLSGALKRGFQSATGAPTQESDPIDHPVIAAMSLRELADLPLRTDPIATRAHRHGGVERAMLSRRGSCLSDPTSPR
jgi:hypothetical protein